MLRVAPTMAWKASLPASRSTWGDSIRSLRMRCSESTHTLSAKNVTMIHDNALDAAIMNMIIICNRAACCTSAPPRIAPVIIPGIEMMPKTLQRDQRMDDGRGTRATHLIWLMVGIRASRSAFTASGRHASNRDAPNASSVSVLSRFSLQHSLGRHALRGGKERRTRVLLAHNRASPRRPRWRSHRAYQQRGLKGQYEKRRIHRRSAGNQKPGKGTRKVALL